MGKQEKISVIVIRVGEAPKEEWIPNTLEAVQELVGGYIESVSLVLPNPFALLVNEEGLLRSLPPNRMVRSDALGPHKNTVFVGNIVVLQTHKGEWVDMEHLDVKAAMWWINHQLVPAE
jgi:hypothetical protein